MLQRQEKAQYRQEIFRHLDGIVTAPIAFSLHKKGVLKHLLEHEKGTLSELTKDFKANRGYLNVALRVLCSQGWLHQTYIGNGDDLLFEVTPNGRKAFPLAPLYQEVVDLLAYSGQFHPRRFEQKPFEVLRRIFHNYLNGYDLPAPSDEETSEVGQQIRKHIEGLLVGPTMVHLGMGGMFHKYFMEASFRPEEYHQHPENFRELLRFLVSLGWFQERNETFSFTDKGLFFAQRASAYGVTVSYMPLLREMDELLFGNPHILRDIPEGQPEAHVDREMNVWGSGGAHTTYFKKVDEIIIDIFNQPIERQPKGILDMGCGNGAFLKHIFEVIEQRTLRGQMLADHPLFLVGVDYNETALRVTRANLIQADIWAKIIWGDIGRPDLLARDLNNNYGIALNDLLNVRTFLDHNRIWQEPSQPGPSRPSKSTGAFAYRGKFLSNHLVEESLKEHFNRWTPYLDKYGLLVIELHTISPELAAKNIGQTAVTAYDATHGFSDQYIVEIEVFLDVARQAGLEAIPQYAARFPDNDLATISINLLKTM